MYPKLYSSKFIENTERLLKFALDRMEPFECKDIEKATLEIREQKQRLLELEKTVEMMKKQKKSLMMALEMMRQQNFHLEKNNQNLSMQASTTASSLIGNNTQTVLSYSTTSLIIFSSIILFIGLVLRVAASSLYNNQVPEVTINIGFLRMYFLFHILINQNPRVVLEDIVLNLKNYPSPPNFVWHPT